MIAVDLVSLTRTSTKPFFANFGFKTDNHIKHIKHRLVLKEATKSYFRQYSSVVIILFKPVNAGLRFLSIVLEN